MCLWKLSTCRIISSKAVDFLSTSMWVLLLLNSTLVCYLSSQNSIHFTMVDGTVWICRYHLIVWVAYLLLLLLFSDVHLVILLGLGAHLRKEKLGRVLRYSILLLLLWIHHADRKHLWLLLLLLELLLLLGLPLVHLLELLMVEFALNILLSWSAIRHRFVNNHTSSLDAKLLLLYSIMTWPFSLFGVLLLHELLKGDVMSLWNIAFGFIHFGCRATWLNRLKLHLAMREGTARLVRSLLDVSKVAGRNAMGACELLGLRVFSGGRRDKLGLDLCHELWRCLLHYC